MEIENVADFLEYLCVVYVRIEVIFVLILILALLKNMI